MNYKNMFFDHSEKSATLVGPNSTNNVDEQQIKQIALNLYNTKSYIDVVDIANHLGIDVYEANNSVKDACIRFNSDSNKYEIDFNEAKGKKRIRFSIAHEIAHYILHRDTIRIVGQIDRDDEHSLTSAEENDADSLAAEILMPSESVENFLVARGIESNGKCDEDTVVAVAEHFNVSTFAAVTRIRNLGYYVPYLTF